MYEIRIIEFIIFSTNLINGDWASTFCLFQVPMHITWISCMTDIVIWSILKGFGIVDQSLISLLMSYIYFSDHMFEYFHFAIADKYRHVYKRIKHKIKQEYKTRLWMSKTIVHCSISIHILKMYNGMQQYYFDIHIYCTIKIMTNNASIIHKELPVCIHANLIAHKKHLWKSHATNAGSEEKLDYWPGAELLRNMTIILHLL